MRAITQITIQKRTDRVTMFLTYNGNSSDYSFNNYDSVEEAIESLPKNNPHYSLEAKGYRLLDFSAGAKNIMPTPLIEF